MSDDDPTKNLDNHALLLQLIAMFRAFEEQLKSFDARLQGFDAWLQGIDERLQSFDARLQDFDARLREHDAKIESLERTLEARIYDTRPMWEAVQVQIVELRAEMEKGFRRSDRKAALFHEQVSDLYAYQRDMEERLEKLEPKTQ
jgi:chromosome segregation ATPase